MNVIPKNNFVGKGRGFEGCLPLDNHTADMFTYLQENYDFQNILEFGYQNGHSSTWWLYAFPYANVTAYDPKENTYNKEKIHDLMKEKFGRRFKFYSCFSAEARKYASTGFYDVVFIDGGHTFGAVYDDIETALMLEIPILLIDNMELEPQQKAVEAWSENLLFTKQFKYYTINSDKKTYERYVNLYNVLSYDIQK